MNTDTEKRLNGTKPTKQRETPIARMNANWEKMLNHGFPLNGGQTGVLKNKFIFLKLFGWFMPLKSRKPGHIVAFGLRSPWPHKQFKLETCPGGRVEAAAQNLGQQFFMYRVDSLVDPVTRGWRACCPNVISREMVIMGRSTADTDSQAVAILMLLRLAGGPTQPRSGIWATRPKVAHLDA